MKLNLSCDDINLLIYRYLLENGYCHTAFSFNKEGDISKNPLYVNHADRIPPNALVSFMQKAMIYIYLEYHTDDITGEQIVCDEPFSFFRKHSCFKKIGQSHGLPLSQSLLLAKDLHHNPDTNDGKATQDAIPNLVLGGDTNSICNLTPIYVGPPQRQFGEKWHLSSYYILSEYMVDRGNVMGEVTSQTIFNPVVPTYLVKKVEGGPPSIYRLGMDGILPASLPTVPELIPPLRLLNSVSIDPNTPSSHVRHGNAGYCVNWSSDGQHLAIGYDDGNVAVWSIDATLTLTQKVYDEPVTSISIRGVYRQPKQSDTPDIDMAITSDAYLAVGSAGGSLNIYRVDGGKLSNIHTSSMDHTISDLTWSSQNILSMATIEGVISLYTLSMNEDNKIEVYTFKESFGTHLALVEWDGTGMSLAISQANNLKIHRVVQSIQDIDINTLKGHTAPIVGGCWFQYQPDRPDHRICTIGMDKQMIIWDATSSTIVACTTLAQIPTTIAVRPGNTHIAVGCYGNTLKVYVVPGLSLSFSLCDNSILTNISWSSDGHHLAYNVYGSQKSILLPWTAINQHNMD